jgi:hypothetical protein
MKMSRIAVALACVCGSAALNAAPMAGLSMVNGQQGIAYFDSETPQTIVGFNQLRGLAAGETIVGIDTRPATGELFGLGSLGRIYNISTIGAASTLSPTTVALDGTAFGIDFNPTVDRIRVVSNNDQNLRFNPITGALAATDTVLSPSGDKVGVAYDRNAAGATVTTMFVIDSGSDTLAIQGGVDGNPSPNGGVITNIGPLGFNTSDAVGFDIGVSGVARALLTVNGVSGVYNINLTTGAANLIGNTGLNVTDITFIPAFPPAPIVTQLPGLSNYGMLALAGVLLLSGLFLMRRFS